MLKHEFNMIKKNKRTIIVLLFLSAVVMLELYETYKSALLGLGYVGSWQYPDKRIKMLTHPAFASFLSCMTEGHRMQIIYEWLLPVHLLLMYSDRMIEEVRSGYFGIMISRTGKKKVLKGKYFFSFLLGFSVVFGTLLLNYVVAIIFFHGGKDFGGMLLSYYPTHPVFAFSMRYPYIAYFLYILVDAIIGGGCAMICTGLSFIFKQYRHLYLAAFLIWYVQIIAPNSLTYVTQPFIEYDLPYILPALGTFFVIWWTVVFAGYFYRIKRDEL